MAIPYFTQEFHAFFKELSVNNDRDWFNANKARFKKVVEIPFLNFLMAMIDRMRAVDPGIVITPKDAIFRIYRDTRFSKDKTPYKTHMSAIISPAGRKGPHSSGAYFHADHKEFSIYGGAYSPERKELMAIRSAIAGDLKGFDKLIQAPAFKEKFGMLQGEENKRIPAELMEAAAKQPLIFKKSFYFFHKFPAETLLKEDLPEIVMEYYLTGKPLGDFFAKAING